jgi:hypothetical protein
VKEILGKAKTVRELLKGVKYSIDYYQREYKWHEKQIRELVDDLVGKFQEGYQPEHSRNKVGDYPHYFLGSIIISKKENTGYIVDGQQRLTSLTLLLLLLRNLQKDRPDDVKVNVDELIYSTRYGQKSFNLDVEERIPAMVALFDGQLFEVANYPESVQNLVARYRDLESCFPVDLREGALPYFVDWLLENVHLVEITAYSDDDAYTIFETMNDRGLSLSPTDMLKGYLLANMDEAKRTAINQLWRGRIRALNDAGKEVEADCFKAWLRSQYAEKIRERKKNARPEDFDRIGTEFHRWVRDASADIGLTNSDAFYRFVQRDFNFYSRVYLRCIEACETLTPGLEPIFYNAFNGFTLQHILLLAPLRPDDPDPIVNRKLWLVARFIDILLAWRLWNYRLVGYNNMQYAMFLVMRDIRGLGVDELAEKLHSKLAEEPEDFMRPSEYHSSDTGFSMHQQNRRFIHGMLARMTDYVETQSGLHSRFMEYVSANGTTRYEVEHIWANKPDRHTDEFGHTSDFARHRNRIGGLILLPKSFNASYGDLPYSEKHLHYNSQNLLARSLNQQAYEHNPGFRQFIEGSGLPFRPHEQFKKADLDARCDLYRELAQLVWNPKDLLQ